jgi:hypothetical protein
MPRQLDPRIAEILRNYGEDPTDSKGVIWDCHGTWVVYHKALERVAARAGISFDKPDVLRAERDEAVIMVTGRMADRTDWDIGEALIGVNYRVSGKQAAYVYAMALKRGRDRLILKLVGLHGLLYSEEEADEFKPAAAQPDAANEMPPRTTPREVKQAQSRALMDVLREVEQCESANDLTALWRTPEMKDMLAGLEQAEYGVARAAFEKKGNALKAAA